MREVVVVGRRGPAQAAFTNPELRELGELADADVIVDPAELERALAVPDPAATRSAKRNVEILRDYAERAPARQSRDASCCASCSRPSRSTPTSTGASGAVRLARNELDRRRRRAAARAGHRASTRRSPPGSCSARSATAASPLPGVPFDERAA